MKPTDLNKAPYIMKTTFFSRPEAKVLGVVLGAVLLIGLINQGVQQYTDQVTNAPAVVVPKVKAPLQSEIVASSSPMVASIEALPVGQDGLTADMKHNMKVCANIGLYYLSELTVLGFKAECMTKREYDRRLAVIDRYIANSQLKELR